MNLPNRAFNSPLIRYANFKDGSSINLIRLVKPYASGAKYAIYNTTQRPVTGGLYKSGERAADVFNAMVEAASLNTQLIEESFTGNIFKPE